MRGVMGTLYKYQAATQAGKIQKGRLYAANEQDLLLQLKELQLNTISYKPLLFRFSPLPRLRELLPMFLHLEQLLRAGIPLLESLNSLKQETSHKTLNFILKHLYQEVEAGKMLSVALAQHPKVFTPFFTGLIKVGEETGTLVNVLKHLNHHLKWMYDLKAEITKALRYPFLLIGLMGGVLSVMLGYLVPQFNQFYLNFHQAPSPFTLFFMQLSQGLLEGGGYLIISSILIACLLLLSRIFLKRSQVYIDKLPFYIPFFGILYKKLLLARFVHFFALLLKHEVALLKSFEIIIPLFPNQYFKKILQEIRSHIEGGRPLHLAFKEYSFFPPFFQQLLSAGEKGGALSTTLETINIFYDQEVKHSLENFLSLIEPALKIIIGLIFVGLTLGVFYPLYESFHEIDF